MGFNKKAFTLVEVIGVITILSLMLLVTVPALTKTLKRNEQKKYDAYIDNLRIVSESYVVKQLKEGIVIGDEYYITLGNLIDNGYIENTIVNPENENKLSRDTQIKVTKNLDGSFNYNVMEHYILPDDYMLVEYIESTGTQYINTGVLPNQNTGFDISFSDPDGNINSGTMMGSKNLENGFVLTTYTNDDSLNGTFIYGKEIDDAQNNFDEDVHISLKNKVYNELFPLKTQQFAINVPIVLFALNDNNIVKEHIGIQLYGLKFYDGNDLIRDFVPCYRKKDGTVGLYDLANAKFYTNNGTGEFQKGNDVQ